MKKIVLINNFGMFPTVPPYSTSCVNKILKSKGLDVTHIDLNIQIWEKLLSKDFIRNCTYNEENFKNTNAPFMGEVSEEIFNEIKNNVILNLDKSKHIFRNIDLFNNTEKLSWAIEIIFQAQQVIYCHYGTFINNKLIFWPKFGFNTNLLSQVYNICNDANHNPFINIYLEGIIKKLTELKPDIIGMDIQFPWEIVQVITLNKLIKKCIPKAHINFIGHGFDEFCFSRIAKNFETNSDLMIGFDSAFLARNDEELLKLYSSQILNSDVLKNIKSLAYVSDSGIIKVNEPFYEQLYNDLNYPNYDGLDLKLYYSPEITFNDKLSSKCFWNRCVFCNINKFKSKRCEVDVNRYVLRIKEYVEKYGCQNLFLLDEAATPKLINEFSQKILDSGIKIFWSIRTRVDSGFDYQLLKKMYDAGCREIWIGIEAISPRLLSEMRKTDSPVEYVNVVKNEMKLCKEIGIGIHSCFLFAFPTERDSDRQELYEFFVKNNDLISRVPFFATFNVFNLNTGTYIYNHFSDYGIKKILYDKSNFNMINIPFVRSDTGKLQSEIEPEIDAFCDKLTSVFVKNDKYKLLWFTVGDSSWELLMKKYCNNKNIFQINTNSATDSKIKTQVYH